MVLAVSTFDDRFLARILPLRAPVTQRPALAHRLSTIGVGILVAILSIQPIRNMLSPAQVMNTVYNRFHLVGTYGAFGSITRPRYEVIVEGADEQVPTASTEWREYEFKGKPGALGHMPPQQPWFAPFMQKLLEGNRPALSPATCARCFTSTISRPRPSGPRPRNGGRGSWWVCISCGGDLQVCRNGLAAQQS
jgi:hypothetical protein